MEEVISFRNKHDKELFGILHKPDKVKAVDSKVGINLLNPGLKNRVAPNRLNIKIARKLCELGYPVLRFDPHGIGDSEGNFMGSNEPSMDLWGAIQRGSFVEDTISSNEYLCSNEGIKKIIIIGQCGAAVTAGIVGNKDKRVDRLILIDTPFTLLSSDLELINLILENRSTKQLISEYMHDFIRFDWIKKLFTKGINKAYLNKKIKYFKQTIDSRYQKSNNSISERYNNLLSDSLLKFLDAQKKIFFMFAGNDRSLSEFNNSFNLNVLQQNSWYDDYCSIDIIDTANHIYTSIESQEELIGDICKSITS